MILSKTYKLKNKATSNIKIHHVPSSLSFNDVGIYLRDGPFKSDVGIAYLHISKETHLITYINENLFDSYRCTLPQKLSNFFIKRNGYCFYSQF